MADELVVIDGDTDATIEVNTPEVVEGTIAIDDAMRVTMERVLDPEVPTYELTFAERKIAVNLNWL